MSRFCGYPLATGATCRQAVADPTRLDCGRHTGTNRSITAIPADRWGCRMQESPPGVWRCLVHDPDSPEWQAASALGARPPCRIPGATEYKQTIAKTEAADLRSVMLLVKDPDPQVRGAVADSLNATASILGELASDSSWLVRHDVANNSNAPVPVLERLAGDPEWQVRCAVAGNPNTPGPVLERLAKDPDENVRHPVAENPNTPASVLRELTLDHNVFVRSAAEERLQDPLRGIPQL